MKTITSPSLNVILRKKETKKDLISFLHAACCSPTSTTWIKAIENNQFATWPGLNTRLIKKHLPPSIATAQGHLKQERHGLQSTKGKNNTKDIKIIKQPTDSQEQTILDDYFPQSASPNVKTQEVLYTLMAPDQLSVAFSD